jgi:hypothetical protein
MATPLQERQRLLAALGVCKTGVDQRIAVQTNSPNQSLTELR